MKTLVYNLRNTTAQVTDAQSTLTHNGATHDAARGTTRVHRHSRPSFIARLFMTLTLLLTLGAGEMWGASEGSNWYDASDAKVYFDNTNSSYTNVSMLIGRQWNYGGVGDAGSWGINFSKVSGTNNLYYASVSATKYTTFAFINATDWGWETNKVTARLSWATNTDTPNDNLSSDSHLYIPASSSDGASVTHTSLSSYSTLNYTQTLKQTLSTDGGSSYSESTSALATVKVTANYLTSNNATTSHNSKISSGNSSTTCTAARTATVTCTVSSTATGYTFVGWYEGNTQKSTETTYTYTCLGEKTITARFKANQYTITYKDKGNVAFSGTHGTGYPTSHTYGTTTTLDSPTKTGYTFGGWFTASACTGTAVTSLSATGYTSNIILYAKWTQDPGVSLNASKTTINIGETITLTATGANASNITKYEFYEGSTKINTATTSSTTATYSYKPTTVGNKTLKVVMTYNSGSNSITSSNVTLTINTPSVALAESSSTTEMWIGENPTEALTFAATSSNVNSGASVTWSISDASSGTFTQTSAGSYSGKSWTYTPASTGDKTITVTMTVGGANYTKTYSLKVYERWNIYVQNNCNWANGIYYYTYGNGSNADWPGVHGTGTGCEVYQGKWYKVTLDSYYPNFILNNGDAGEQSEDLTMSKSTYAAGTFWYFNYKSEYSGTKYYYLTKNTSLAAPTVTLDTGDGQTYMVNTNQIFATAHITSYGDGSSAAADMIEVGFKIGDTEYPMTCKTGDDASYFWGYITGLTAGTSYTVKAYAKNIKGTGVSSNSKAITTRATGTTTIKVRSALARTAPKIYAWTGEASCNGTKQQNATAPGEAMTLAATGTVYKWYTYDLPNTYNKFYISEGSSATQTDDFDNPFEETCYWYHPKDNNTTNKRMGAMICPSFTPQLMIDDGNGGDFTFLDMSPTTGNAAKSMTLTGGKTYRFKVIYQGEYFSKNSTTLSCATRTVAALNASDENNLTLRVDFDGTYTFTFNTSSKALTVTFPTINKLMFFDGEGNLTNDYDLDTHVGTTYSKAVNLSANTTYQFMVVYNCDFYCFKTGSPEARANNPSNPVTAYNCNDAWRVYQNESGTENCYLSTTLAGNYTFRFNSNDGGNTTLKIDFPQNIIFSCEKNEWAQSTTNMTETSTGSGIYYINMTLSADDDEEFKIIYNSAWYGGDNAGKFITADDYTNKALTPNGHNYHLATTLAGTYRITFNTSNKQVSVTYPAFPTMSGTLSFGSSQTGKVCGTGTDENPFLVFSGKDMTLAATHTSKPATGTDHIYYKYTINSVPQTPKQGDMTHTLTGAATASTTDNRAFTISAYYEYGPEGHKKQSNIVTSDTYNYKVIAAPTISIALDKTEVEKNKNFTLTPTTTGTDLSCLSKGPWYQVQYSKWNGSTWGAWTDKSAGDYPAVLAPAEKGFYKWRVKMYYGATSKAECDVFTSNEVQNAVYEPYIVTIDDQNAGGWMTHIYAFRSANTDLVPAQWNRAFPGEGVRECATQVEAHKFIYILKSPIYSGLVLSDGSNNNANKTADITITSNTCITLKGANTSGTAQWKFTKTNDCVNTYYRIRSEFNHNGVIRTYYSNVVTQTTAQVSFFAGKSSDNKNKIYKETLTASGWTNTGALTPYANENGIYVATFENLSSTYQKYTGNLYIRSELATGRFDNYTDADKDNKMINFGPRVTYDYYWVKFSGNALKSDGTTPYGADYVNIDAEVGNTINPCLARHYSDNGDITGTGANMGKVSKRNVRYSYDSQTNWLDVAVIGESTNSTYTFLSIFGADSDNETASTTVYMADGTTATWEKDDTRQVKFLDLSNWTYQADMVVNKTTNNDVKVGIQARLNGTSYVQDIVPRSKPLVILGNESTNREYTMRAIYDFKTNTIIAGWLPAATENIGSSTVNVEGNMILNRVERGSVQQIQTSGAGQVKGLQLLYTTLEIQRDNVAGDFRKVHGASGTENTSTNLYYWISLPYECDIDSIFGIPGAYGDKWAICRYDGESRARDGFWVDSDSYWKWLKLDPGEENNHIMKPNEGYVLVLDLKRADFQEINIKESADDEEGTDYASIFVYFPSTGRAGKTFTLNNQTQSVTLDSYVCTIPGRENYDSGWHMVGVPGFNDVTITSTNPLFTETKQIPAFYYEYVYDGNIYSSGSSGSSKNNAYLYHVNTNDTYKAFHGYCIQYNGTINWAAATTNKQAVPAARHAAANDGNTIRSAKLRLTLNDGDNELDNTYIALSSTATTDFDFNLDLDKIINNNNPNIYTLYGEQPLGANCLPLETQTVPVGLQTIATADYTFALDSVPDGLQAILVDTEADTETDLSKDTYTVELDAGTYNLRFHIRLAPAAADIATELHSNTASGISATLTDDGRLLLNGMNDNGSDVSVFDPAGRLVYQQHTYRGQAIDLPATQGVYLIRLGNEVLRVVK